MRARQQGGQQVTAARRGRVSPVRDDGGEVYNQSLKVVSRPSGLRGKYCSFLSGGRRGGLVVEKQIPVSGVSCIDPRRGLVLLPDVSSILQNRTFFFDIFDLDLAGRVCGINGRRSFRSDAAIERYTMSTLIEVRRHIITR